MAETRFAPPAGRRPSLDWLAPAELEIDPSYQRSIDSQASRRLIRRIAASWLWDLCLPLLVSRRPAGVHYVVDGQHRLAAARMRGDIHVLPCFVRELDDAAAEASLFITANRSRRGITAVEDFHAAVAAGDADCALLAALIAGADLRVGASSPISPPGGGGVGELSCVVGLKRALSRHGPEVVGAALTLIGEAFPDEQLVHGSALAGGMIMIFASNPDIDRDRLFEAALSRTWSGWMEFVGLDRIKGGRQRSAAVHDAILAAYGAGARLEEAA